jgi:hypothetical protein
MHTHVIGGGTVFHVRPHLALAAPAYGATARRIHALLAEAGESAQLHLTRMAGDPKGPETNADVARLLDQLVADPEAKRVFLNAALCDYEGTVAGVAAGKQAPRLRTSDGEASIALVPAEKLASRLRRERKDLFVVAFKTTASATPREQYEAGLGLLKRTSSNLVLANDLHTRLSMVVTPELARYHETNDRDAALRGLVAMTLARSGLHFTRTTLVPGALVPFSHPEVPRALRVVVEHCVERGAYKPFNGVTVGHFAFRANARTLVSSRRKQDFNLPSGRDLVRVELQGEGDGARMIAHGAKPSAGTPSQFAVLSAFPEYDCIVHFHCPARPASRVPVRPQRDLECGSHECGQNTKAGMTRFGSLAAVMLDQHGPNVVFHPDVDPAEVIAFIEESFDLTRRSDDP